MPNIYKHRNKLNQLALKKQKDFPILICTTPIEGFITTGEKANIYALYKDKGSSDIYNASISSPTPTFFSLATSTSTSPTLFQVVKETPKAGDPQPFLTADEIKEHFDITPLIDKGLKIEDAQIVFRVPESGKSGKNETVLSKEEFMKSLESENENESETETKCE